MEVIFFVISVLLNGLLIGAIGRLLLPGPDPIGLPATIGVGIAASLGGGVVAYLLFRDAEWTALLFSVVFAVMIVYALRSLRGGSDERVSLDADELPGAEPEPPERDPTRPG
jgi:uncharacterized membrane protein YeaQ/YmgE (transglycosylase-associated protein family)